MHNHRLNLSILYYALWDLFPLHSSSIILAARPPQSSCRLVVWRTWVQQSKSKKSGSSPASRYNGTASAKGAERRSALVWSGASRRDRSSGTAGRGRRRKCTVEGVAQEPVDIRTCTLRILNCAPRFSRLFYGPLLAPLFSRI